MRMENRSPSTRSQTRAHTMDTHTWVQVWAWVCVEKYRYALTHSLSARWLPSGARRSQNWTPLRLGAFARGELLAICHSTPLRNVTRPATWAARKIGEMMESHWGTCQPRT